MNNFKNKQIELDDLSLTTLEMTSDEYKRYKFEVINFFHLNYNYTDYKKLTRNTDITYNEYAKYCKSIISKYFLNDSRAPKYYLYELDIYNLTKERDKLIKDIEKYKDFRKTTIIIIYIVLFFILLKFVLVYFFDFY